MAKKDWKRVINRKNLIVYCLNNNRDKEVVAEKSKLSNYWWQVFYHVGPRIVEEIWLTKNKQEAIKHLNMWIKTHSRG